MAHTSAETWLPKSEESEYLKTLTHLGETIQLTSNQVLFNQEDVDDYFYVVLYGKIHVSMLSLNGTEAILNIMGPGSVIGEAAALLNMPRFSAAKALVDSTLLKFKVSKIEELITKEPKFAIALLNLLSMKQRQMVARLRQAIFDSPERRILDFLNEFYRTHKFKDSDKAVTVHLTHEQIGNLTGLSRVTVTRLINKFKNEGVLEFSGKRIKLTSEFQDKPIISQY